MKISANAPIQRRTSLKRSSEGCYACEPGLVPGAEGGGFLGGLDAPKLISRYFSPFFKVAPRLIAYLPALLFLRNR